MTKSKKSNKKVKKSNKIKKSPVKKSKNVKKNVKGPKMVIKTTNDEESTYKLIMKSGIPMADFEFLKKRDKLDVTLKKLGFPCILKANGRTLTHKINISGVNRDINTLEEAEKAFKDIKKIKGADTVVVQQQVDGIELIVAAKKDSSFGGIISIGLGGVYRNLVKDVVFRITPISKNDVEVMVNELKGFETVNKAKGPINFTSLYKVLSKLEEFVMKGKMNEVVLDPLICNEKECLVVDAKIN